VACAPRRGERRRFGGYCGVQARLVRSRRRVRPGLSAPSGDFRGAGAARLEKGRLRCRGSRVLPTELDRLENARPAEPDVSRETSGAPLRCTVYERTHAVDRRRHPLQQLGAGGRPSQAGSHVANPARSTPSPRAAEPVLPVSGGGGRRCRAPATVTRARSTTGTDNPRCAAAFG
jgi:hypothetical protein